MENNNGENEKALSERNLVDAKPKYDYDDGVSSSESPPKQGETTTTTSGSSNDSTNNGGGESPRRSDINAVRHSHDDPFNLVDRFVSTQRLMFCTALYEIRQGRKESCWLWFVLPTAPYIVNGIERGSSMNRRFALRSDEECIAYLSWWENDGMSLRQNYVTIVNAIRQQLVRGNTMRRMFGSFDDVKAISSFRLFERIGNLMQDEELASLCRQVLELTSSPNKQPKKKSRLLNTRSI